MMASKPLSYSTAGESRSGSKRTSTVIALEERNGERDSARTAPSSTKISLSLRKPHTFTFSSVHSGPPVSLTSMTLTCWGGADRPEFTKEKYRPLYSPIFITRPETV